MRLQTLEKTPRELTQRIPSRMGKPRQLGVRFVILGTGSDLRRKMNRVGRKVRMVMLKRLGRHRQMAVLQTSPRTVTVRRQAAVL